MNKENYFSPHSNFVGVLLLHLIPAIFVKLKKNPSTVFFFFFFCNDRDRFNHRIMNLIQFTLVKSH